MRQAWHKTITSYFEDLLHRGFPIDAFCTGFEQWWNFDRPDQDHLTPREKEILQSVFDVVIAFSSFEKDLRTIPMYKSEQEVRTTVEAALEELRKHPD